MNFDALKILDHFIDTILWPKKDPLKLYISAAEESIGALLTQNNSLQLKQASCFLNNVMVDVETRYSPIEKLYLACILSQ